MVKNIEVIKTTKSGEELINDIDLLLSSLRGASKVGILDIFSKDLLPTIVKRNKLNQTKDQFKIVNNRLEEFNQDVKDLNVTELDGISETFIKETKNIDYFLGLIGNIYTQSKIKETIENLENLRKNIVVIIESLKIISNIYLV